MKMMQGLLLSIALLMSSHAYADDINDTNSNADTTLPQTSSDLSAADPQPMDAAPLASEIAGFTCQDFRDKAKECQPYNCQTPSNVDPTTVIDWNIISKKNDHCVISSTSTDAGLKNDNGKPQPLTKTCEYDEQGINHLANMLDDIRAGHFNANQNANLPGSYSCDINSEGNPISDKTTILLPDTDS